MFLVGFDMDNVFSFKSARTGPAAHEMENT